MNYAAYDSQAVDGVYRVEKILTLSPLPPDPTPDDMDRRTQLIEANTPAGRAAIEVDENVNDANYYLDASLTPQLRPDTPCTVDVTSVPADAATPVTLSQLPADTQITIAGPVSDSLTATGSVELTFAVPGAYTITATAEFPALPAEFKVDAT